MWRSLKVTEVLSVLYLREMSTGDFGRVFRLQLGPVWTGANARITSFVDLAGRLLNQDHLIQILLKYVDQ